MDNAESKTVYVEIEYTKENMSSKESLFATAYDNRRLILQPVQVQDVPNDSDINVEAELYGTNIIKGKVDWKQEQIGSKKESFKDGQKQMLSTLLPRLALLQKENEELKDAVVSFQAQLFECENNPNYKRQTH